MARVEVVSVSFEGEYPVGMYWTVGEEREIDESYIADLPAGLEVAAEDEDAEAAPMSAEAEAEAPPVAAEVTGSMLDTVEATIDELEASAQAIVDTTVPMLRASLAIARAVVEGTPGDVAEEPAPE